ncbi:MAG: hypothetical protein JNG84_07055, partial [Archangium sp.]|nr:hypothetical protein [Archangium sp.]
MNDRFPVVLVAGLAVFGLLGAVVMRSANRGEFAETLSTYRSAHDGARALYVLLQRDGVQVQRLVEDLETLEPHDTVALLGLAIDETELSSKADAGATRWSWGDDDASVLHEKDVERLLAHAKSGATVVAVLIDTKQNALVDALEVWVEHDDEISGLRTLVPGQPTAFTTGVQRVEATVDAYLHAPASAVPVLVDEVNDEPVALWVPH